MLEFEFNGRRSSEFGVIISKVEENDKLLSCSPILGQKNKYHARENIFGTNYDDNYSFNVTLIKNPCKILHVDITNTEMTIVKDEAIGEILTRNVLIFNQGNLLPSIVTEKNNINNEEQYLDFPDKYCKDLDHNIFSLDGTDYFTSNDIREINAWLTSPQLPKMFKFEGDKYFKEDVEFFVIATSSNTENLGRPYSLTITFTCDSPYGYTPEITKEFKVINNSIQSIFDNTDCRDEYIYPVLYIKPYKDGAIEIINHSDENKKLIIPQAKNEKAFYIDCSKFKIYSNDSDGNNNVIPFKELGLSPNMYWPRLVFGKNMIEFNGTADIKIIYREPRKVGVFA